MSILVVGSVAFDSVKTPFGEVENVLGGSALYFSLAASFFTQVNLVAAVGDDFQAKELKIFNNRNIDIKGLQHKTGDTFRWKGEYGSNLNEAKTLAVALNVFEDFTPQLPQEYKKSEFVFLGNINPELQLSVLTQIEKPRLVACDTMNFWIESKRDVLRQLLTKIDLLVINETEARDLAGEVNLVKAARQLLDWGPSLLIIKRGEYGAMKFSGDGIFYAPAYPLEAVFDPTGAGDSFAGGVMGHLARSPQMDEASIRQAIIFGSVMASYAVEAFSLQRLAELTTPEIGTRFQEFKRLSHFESLILNS